MFLKPGNSDTENGIENELKNVKNEENHTHSKKLKPEKTLFERYQNNMALGVDYHMQFLTDGVQNPTSPLAVCPLIMQRIKII